MKKTQVMENYYESIGLLQYIKSGEIIVDDDGVIDWDRTSSSGNVSDALMNKMPKELNWSLIMEHQDVREDTINRFSYLISFDIISRYRRLPLSYIVTHKNSLNWKHISNLNIMMNPEFIKTYADKIDWSARNVYNFITLADITDDILQYIIKSKDAQIAFFKSELCTVEFLEEHWGLFNKNVVCRYGPRAIELYDKHRDELIFTLIALRTDMPIDWYHDHIHDINFHHVMRNRRLTDDEFKMVLDFLCVDLEIINSLIRFQSRYRDDDLLKEMIQYMNGENWKMAIMNIQFDEDFICHLIAHQIIDFDTHIDTIIMYQRLSEKFLHTFRNELNWSRVCTYQPMSEKFVLKHAKYMDWDALFDANPAYSPKVYKKANRPYPW